MQGLYRDSKEKSSRKLPRLSESLLSSSQRSKFLVECRRTVRPKLLSKVFCYRLSFTHVENLDQIVNLFFSLFHSESKISFLHQPVGEFHFHYLFAFIYNFLLVEELSGGKRFFLF